MRVWYLSYDLLLQYEGQNVAVKGCRGYKRNGIEKVESRILEFLQYVSISRTTPAYNFIAK